MISALLDRDPPALVAVALYGLFVATLAVWATIGGVRRGAPWRWTAAEAYGFVAVAIVGSFGWFWVDGPVEGPATLVISERHGITHGDLLALPAMAAAAFVLAGRVRRVPGPR